MGLPEFLNEADGEIRLTGSRIGLYNILRIYNEGFSPAQIAEEFPSLALDHIAKVIAFYLENRADVDNYLEAYRQDLERQEALNPPRPGHQKIQKLLDAVHQADHNRAGDPTWAQLTIVEKVQRLEKENAGQRI